MEGGSSVGCTTTVRVKHGLAMGKLTAKIQGQDRLGGGGSSRLMLWDSCVAISLAQWETWQARGCCHGQEKGCDNHGCSGHAIEEKEVAMLKLVT